MRVAIRGGRGVRPGARRLPLPAVLAALVLLVPATPALADSLPPVPIDVTETVGASDGAAALPPMPRLRGAASGTWFTMAGAGGW